MIPPIIWAVATLSNDTVAQQRQRQGQMVIYFNQLPSPNNGLNARPERPSKRAICTEKMRKDYSITCMTRKNVEKGVNQIGR
jgi:hypothetical protein